MSHTAANCEVVVTEATQAEWQSMLDRLAGEKFGLSWDAFVAAYRAGEFLDTPSARDAEELAFLAPVVG